MPNATNSHTFTGGIDVRQFEQYNYVTIPDKFIRQQ